MHVSQADSWDECLHEVAPTGSFSQYAVGCAAVITNNKTTQVDSLLRLQVHSWSTGDVLLVALAQCRLTASIT